MAAQNVDKVFQLDGNAKDTFTGNTLKPGHMFVTFATRHSRKRLPSKCMNDVYTQVKDHVPVDFVIRNSSFSIVNLCD